ncbi:MAG: hypothetical protein RL264_590 [Bacteroidota bacterium]|jgi:type I restriction enzyme M protein
MNNRGVILSPINPNKIWNWKHLIISGYIHSPIEFLELMAIKKSELYSSLWASCDELRGGMDASQYKDYVLTMLFVKYVSDKYSGNPMSLIEVPKGAAFEDMVALKGQPDIGDRINKEILRPLFAANGLEGSMELADFNDDDKLGSDKEKVDRLSKLIAIFENPALNFKNNRAEDDDILGDAYEYLMQHFATESGKSKGQFYTPSEVSRILAKVIGANKADKPSFTAYDPTCGSASLLMKVAEEAPNGLTIYGQEKDIATKGLAIMNMWLHGHPEAQIAGKNTIADPQFKENDGTLKRFDFVVANPPFSVKNWTSGINPSDDLYNRFSGYGIPPEKNGDYAFLLHILASLKSTGKGAVILPHGVLFRGNAEAEIRKNIIQRKWIKGIIGLPANLFYGTGIPACIIVVDKEHTDERKGIFMIDASKGYIKDGNKNRLREQDLHKIVDVFNFQKEEAKFSRFVSFEEIEKNEYNLNIPRYIDTQEEEDIQDLNAHLNGGIPLKDIDGLQAYWEVYPSLRKELFSSLREGYVQLNVEANAIKETIYKHPEFTAYSETLDQVFTSWKNAVYADLQGIQAETAPKKFIHHISEALLNAYHDKALVNKYDIYQHLLNYWNETMKDDVYLIVEDGWVAKTKRILEKNNKGKEVDKGWTCDLIPKSLVVQKYLSDEQEALQDLNSELESVQAEMAQYEEEHAGEEGLLADATNDKGSLTKATLTKYVKDNKGNTTEKEGLALANQLLKLLEKEADLKKSIKAREAELDQLTLEQYGKLTEAEVRTLVVEDKWLTSIKASIQTEIDAISQRLTNRIKELGERYDTKLSELEHNLSEVESRVAEHLQKMGLVWS